MNIIIDGPINSRIYINNYLRVIFCYAILNIEPPDRNTEDWRKAFCDNPRLPPVNKIAPDIAAVPGRLFKVAKDGSREEITEHPFLDFMNDPSFLNEINRSAFWRIMEIWGLLKPFDVDVRTEAEMNAYNLEQSVKRRKNADTKQYVRYRTVLGSDAPKTFAVFERIKYNNRNAWDKLQREYKLFNRIDANENYSAEYRNKLKDAYAFFKENGFEFTEHGLGRALNPKSGKGKEPYTPEDILTVLRKRTNYLDGENRTVKFYNCIAVIQGTDTGEVISIVYRQKPNQRWETINNGDK